MSDRLCRGTLYVPFSSTLNCLKSELEKMSLKGGYCTVDEFLQTRPQIDLFPILRLIVILFVFSPDYQIFEVIAKKWQNFNVIVFFTDILE